MCSCSCSWSRASSSRLGAKARFALGRVWVAPGSRSREKRRGTPGNAGVGCGSAFAHVKGPTGPFLLVTGGAFGWLRWGDSNSTSPICSIRGQETVGRRTCGFGEHPVTARVRRCPRFAIRLRTQHGPAPLGHGWLGHGRSLGCGGMAGPCCGVFPSHVEGYVAPYDGRPSCQQA
jgi:hypothetical protein